MPKKNLKSKLKAQVRKVNSMREQEHAQAGLTINFELQAMQAVAMSHGILATLQEVSKQLGTSGEIFKSIEKVCQDRMLQCHVQLLEMGIPQDEINQRVIQGH